MADEVDIANDMIQQELDARIAAARMEQTGPGPELCVECEEVIAEGRRALGFYTCIECARLAERFAERLKKHRS